MAGLPMFSRPLYLVTGDMPVPSTSMPRSVQAKMTELRAALQALAVEAQQIENDLLVLSIEGTLREYGESWSSVTLANPPVKHFSAEQQALVLDVLTRAALNSLPIQVASAEEFDLLLRKHTMINLDVIKSMCESYERLAAR